MKKLWNMMSFMAVVNLLAMIVFVGWLYQTGRLDVDRVRQIKDMFAPTIEQERQAAANSEAQAEIDRQQAEELARKQSPPLPSADQIREESLVKDQTGQALRRLRDEREQLKTQQDLKTAQLDRREAELEARIREWEQSIAKEADRRQDVQFQKVVKQYESIPPKNAKRLMLELLGQGGQDQVVAYIDGMNARAAAKIIKEFKTDQESALAAGLLEKLRTFGLDAVPEEDSSDDDAIVSAD